jgi:hypothetical protein
MVCAALFGRFFIKHCKRASANKNKDFQTRRPPKKSRGITGIFEKGVLEL